MRKRKRRHKLRARKILMEMIAYVPNDLDLLKADDETGDYMFEKIRNRSSAAPADCTSGDFVS